jgi:hypothetical protein
VFTFHWPQNNENEEKKYNANFVPILVGFDERLFLKECSGLFAAYLEREFTKPVSSLSETHERRGGQAKLSLSLFITEYYLWLFPKGLPDGGYQIASFKVAKSGV